jgi:Asp-tRNA(Asn)/Glu-tRNA(Gln) amidotransferase A subunit family amidase
VGYVEFLKNTPAMQNSALVAILLELGAVLYVKTNIPQTMMVSGSEFALSMPRLTACRQRTLRIISLGALSTLTTHL